jgi:hypothetical protein
MDIESFLASQAGFERKWVLFIRQSSVRAEFRHDRASLDLARQVMLLTRIGVPEDQRIIINSARGSRGVMPVQHPFDELVRLVETGTVGVVVVSALHHLTRDSVRFEQVISSLARHRGMLLLGNSIYDPRETIDSLAVRIRLAELQYRRHVRRRTRVCLNIAGRLPPSRRAGADVVGANDPDLRTRDEAPRPEPGAEEEEQDA